MPTLYSGPLSLFTAKVRIALAEKGIDYERIEVPFGRQGYEPKHPKVIEINPKQQVPVFVDGEDGAVALWDSTVIVEYLDERWPDPRLLPEDPGERARVRMAELHADEVFFPSVWILIANVFYGGGDPDEIAAAKTALAREYAALDARLKGREWIAADRFNPADVTYRLATLFASTLGAAPSPELANLGEWIARMDAKPSVANEMADMMRAMADLNR